METASTRSDTTMALRNKLGFYDESLWKRFCVRRLSIIHALSLNTRKASEQEEQVREVAKRLCSEYGYPESACGDFEKLIRAGIQSVRRNQKRSPRHLASIQHQRFADSGASSTSFKSSYQSQGPMMWLRSSVQSESTSGDSASPQPQSAEGSTPFNEAIRYAGEGLLMLSVSSAVTQAHMEAYTASLLQGLMPGSVLSSALGSVLGVTNIRDALGSATLRNTTGVLASLTSVLVDLLARAGPNPDEMATLLYSEYTGTGSGSGSGSGSETTPTAASSAANVGSTQGPVKLEQGTRATPEVSGSEKPPSEQPPVASNLVPPLLTSQGNVPRPAPGPTNTPPRLPPVLPSLAPTTHDKQVTLRFQNHALALTFSPLKNSLPTLAEIFEHARRTFHIPPDVVARLRDAAHGRIIETDADLIDAFCQPRVDLELVLPPPMLPRLHPMGPHFAPVAPIMLPPPLMPSTGMTPPILMQSQPHSVPVQSSVPQTMPPSLQPPVTPSGTPSGTSSVQATVPNSMSVPPSIPSSVTSPAPQSVPSGPNGLLPHLAAAAAFQESPRETKSPSSTSHGPSPG